MLHFPRKVLVDWLESSLGVLTKGGDRVRLAACPWCGRSRPAYVFNLSSQRFRCYRCGTKAGLYDLVKKVNPNCFTLEDIIKDIYSGGDVWGMEFTDGLEQQAFEDFWTGFTDKFPEETLAMPVDYSCDFSTPIGECVYRYAEMRKLPTEAIQSGEIGYAKGTMSNRLVFLIVENKKVVYWFGRAIYDWMAPKVLYPKNTSVGKGKDEVVFGLDKLQKGDRVACCEGGISALSATRDGWKGIAILGNEMSYHQAYKISKLTPSRFVFLREDGISMQHAADQCLRLESFGTEAEVGTLINGDPNDDPTQLVKVYSNTSKVSPFTGWFQ